MQDTWSTPEQSEIIQLAAQVAQYSLPSKKSYSSCHFEYTIQLANDTAAALKRAEDEKKLVKDVIIPQVDKLHQNKIFTSLIHAANLLVEQGKFLDSSCYAVAYLLALYQFKKQQANNDECDAVEKATIQALVALISSLLKLIEKSDESKDMRFNIVHLIKSIRKVLQYCTIEPIKNDKQNITLCNIYQLLVTLKQHYSVRDFLVQAKKQLTHFCCKRQGKENEEEGTEKTL